MSEGAQGGEHRDRAAYEPTARDRLAGRCWITPKAHADRSGGVVASPALVAPWLGLASLEDESGATGLTGPALRLDREEILSFRRRTGALDERLAAGPDSLAQPAAAGLQDSMPRAALLSLHARVRSVGPETWSEPPLVQLWGPGYSVFVVAEPDVALFTLSRLPEAGQRRRRAEELAARLSELLAGGSMTYDRAGALLGVHPNSLRYAALTGTVLIRWEGAGASTIWTVPRPEMEPAEARAELARRFLHSYGPSTPASFARWAGMNVAAAESAFELLSDEVIEVLSPIGPSFLLSSDEALMRSSGPPERGAPLIPSGDPYFLLHGPERELLVPDERLRAELWTPRVWPGALLLDGEIAGTWRRSQGSVTVRPWRRLSRAELASVEAEVASLPLPGLRAAPSLCLEE